MFKNKCFLSIFLLLMGVFFPTSINGVISSNLMFLKVLIFYIFAIYSILKQKKLNIPTIVSFTIVIFILMLSTLLVPLNNYVWETSIFFIGFYLMMLVDLSDITISTKNNNFFTIFNIITIVLGISIVFGNELISDFLVKNYSNHNPHLVSSMLALNKPVLTFGSHSIAALFIFCLFYINFKYYELLNKKINLLCSVFYLSFLYFLQSNTGYLFLLIGISYILFYTAKHLRKSFILIILYSASLILFLYGDEFFNMIQLTYKQIQINLFSPINGIRGRFGDQGVLQVNLNYIAQNPFRPIGFAYNPNLTYTDSGFVELMTRGSIMLPIIIYPTFFMFLKKNLTSNHTAYILFFIFIMCDVMIYPIFRLSTTFYLLPFMIIFLNNIVIPE